MRKTLGSQQSISLQSKHTQSSMPPQLSNQMRLTCLALLKRPSAVASSRVTQAMCLGNGGHQGIQRTPQHSR